MLAPRCERMVAHFYLQHAAELTARYNVAPSQAVATVCQSNTRARVSTGVGVMSVYQKPSQIRFLSRAMVNQATSTALSC